MTRNSRLAWQVASGQVGGKSAAERSSRRCPVGRPATTLVRVQDSQSAYAQRHQRAARAGLILKDEEQRRKRQASASF